MKKKKFLFFIIILGVFAISIIPLAVGTRTENVPLMSFGVGFLFSFFGVSFLVSKKIIGLPISIIGFILFSYSLSELFGNGYVGKFLIDNFAIIFGLLFFNFGLFGYFNTIGIRLWKRHFYCTEEVIVEVIKDETLPEYLTNSLDNDLHKLIYKYNYNGKSYTKSYDFYSSALPHNGKFKTYINPNDPNDIVIPLLDFPKYIITFICFLLMTVGLYCMYIAFFNLK